MSIHIFQQHAHHTRCAMYTFVCKNSEQRGRCVKPEKEVEAEDKEAEQDIPGVSAASAKTSKNTNKKKEPHKK